MHLGCWAHNFAYRHCGSCRCYVYEERRGWSNTKPPGDALPNRLLAVDSSCRIELAAGALWDLLRIEYVRVALTHLGYPLYVLIILGVWRIPGALTLLAPRLPRLKEWAYAGAFFDYTGAMASHLLKGNHGSQWIGPAIFSGFTLLSWGLRPASRKLPNAARSSEGNLGISWAVSVLTVAAMLVVAFFTLPKGAPPQ